jgi:hypothetical protein
LAVAVDPDLVGRRPGLVLGPPFDAGGDPLAEDFDPGPQTETIFPVCPYPFHRRLHCQDDLSNMDISSNRPIGYRAVLIR